MSIFETLTDANNTIQNVRNSGNKRSGGSVTDNPYTRMYQDGYGYIFGKPLAYSFKADPNQRVYQRTMLRNNTILNIIPGIPYTDPSMLTVAKEILQRHQEQLDQINSEALISPERAEKKRIALSTSTRDELVAKKCDLRYQVFKQDISGFIKAYQMIINRVGTALFSGNMTANLSSFITDLAAININEDALTRGFKLWVDKGSSVSESMDNSFTASIFEQMVKGLSGAAKQARFAGSAVGMNNTDQTAEVQSSNKDFALTGKLTDILSRSVAGSVFQFPQIFDDSKFTRSYDISFRFMSPYGDDRSVLNYVINPFLFLFTCASPKQDGVSGYTSPFILQVDAPGFFSCPMGVITSFSFKKGGDEALYNNRGLPLIIEGSMTITDLYSNLSLPMNHSQFATNFGTAAFLNNLGGLSLYSTMDPSMKDSIAATFKDGIIPVLQPYSIIKEEKMRLQRYFGLGAN